MEHFKLKLDRTSIEHRRPSINVRSLLPSNNCVTKETSQSANSGSFRAKMRDTPICFPILTILYPVSNCLYFHVKWWKGRHFCCEDCWFVCFETGLGKPMLTLNDPNGLKNTTDVYSIHLELRMAFICKIGAGKWKYVNACLDFIGIPDQRTAYVKRQVRPGWTYHDDVIKWKHFPRNWHFVRGIHRSRWIPRTKASDAEFDVFFDLPLNKRLSKHSLGWWFETAPWSLWRQCNA